MPDLLLELFSEEIPARMQARAADDLSRLMAQGLREAGLEFQASRSMSGPRRLALVIEGLLGQSAATVEERKGPRVGSPDKALQGFLKSAGLKSVAECTIMADPKGEYYVARTERPSRAAAEIVADVVAATVHSFPWPKSMRWGNGRLRWVRPLRSILCILDGEVVPVEVDSIRASHTTYGHRFLSGKAATTPEAIRIVNIRDYETALMHAKVVASRDSRAAIILDGAKRIAAKAALDLVEDHGLLEENAGLVEWPVVYLGAFPENFLNVPPEILMTAMRTHQKCFSLRERGSRQLASKFILVSNLEAKDGGKAIIAGNERVIRARLSDAKFFWENDKARPLESFVGLLGQVTFHDQLGTQLERANRIEALAREIAPLVGADPAKAKEAARLAKADLMSETVGEFPELQGVIGRYIALAQGRAPEVADAIAEHYKPQGPSDAVPSNPVAIAVALADKLDMLAGFWAIGEKPTGSKDPYALRRAALGVIRIVLENGLRLKLDRLLDAQVLRHQIAPEGTGEAALLDRLLHLVISHGMFEPPVMAAVHDIGANAPTWLTLIAAHDPAISNDLLAFMHDRLKVYLRDKGARHDLIDAVFALPGQDDLLMVARRVEALGRFLETEDGATLLALVRRALNILKIEEKKDGKVYDGKPAPKLLRNREEKALSAAIRDAGKQVEAELASENFEAAMAALTHLRHPVDAFFERVTVNADDADMRANRLKLLGQIRALTKHIADFAKIEG